MGGACRKLFFILQIITPTDANFPIPFNVSIHHQWSVCVVAGAGEGYGKYMAKIVPKKLSKKSCTNFDTITSDKFLG